MADTIILNLSAMDRHILDLVDGKSSALEILIKNLSKIEGISAKVALFPSQGDDTLLSEVKDLAKKSGFQPLQPQNEGSLPLLQALSQSGCLKGGLCYWFEGDAPFYDLDLVQKMVQNHRYYGVQFSNGDGYPEGLVPEIWNAEILPALIKLAEHEKGSKIRLDQGDKLFDLLALNINRFDIETMIAPQDTSLMRLKFFSRGLRKSLLCRRLAPLFANIDHTPIETDEPAPFNIEYFADRVVRFLVQNESLLRTRPAFYHIQITTQSPHSCSYLPTPIAFSDQKMEMSPDRLHQLALKAREFSETAVFSLSLWGEPSHHSRISEMIDAVLSVEGLQLLIETSGIGWDSALFRQLKEKYEGKIIWIVTLDSIDPMTYKQLRGEGFEEAFQTAKELNRLFPKECYIQAVRLKEGEAQLEKFWEYWNREGNVLIQKYNHFCKALPERKVVELAPIKRYPCWHLKRDFNILADGSLLVCREDYKGDNVIGNVFEEELDSLFQRTEELYNQQCQGEYPGRCGACDEYYTFNF